VVVVKNPLGGLSLEQVPKRPLFFCRTTNDTGLFRYVSYQYLLLNG
jgi:hypothetical protein